MPSDVLIPVMLKSDTADELAGTFEDFATGHVALNRDHPMWSEVGKACRQALETPPQPDPSQLILEYVEAKRERLMAIATGAKPSSREGEALRALMDFADSRKGN